MAVSILTEVLATLFLFALGILLWWALNRGPNAPQRYTPESSYYADCCTCGTLYASKSRWATVGYGRTHQEHTGHVVCFERRAR